MSEKLRELEAGVRGAAGASDARGAVEVLVVGVADLLAGLTHDPVAIAVLAGDLRGAAARLATAVCYVKPTETSAAPTAPVKKK